MNFGFALRPSGGYLSFSPLFSDVTLQGYLQATVWHHLAVHHTFYGMVRGLPDTGFAAMDFNHHGLFRIPMVAWHEPTALRPGKAWYSM